MAKYAIDERTLTNIANAIRLSNDKNATYTPAEMPDAIKNISYFGVVDNLFPSFEASGSVATCNPVEEYPLGVVSDIEPTQSGSGDPYPPGGGKNLIPNPEPITKTDKGVTFEINGDGSVRISGTPTENASARIGFIPATHLRGKSVAINKNFDESIYLYVHLYYDDGTATTWTWLNGYRYNQYTGVVPSNAKELEVGLVVLTDFDGQPITYYPQLELGTTPTEYAPYSNVRPITGHTSVTLTNGGKNLFDDVAWYESHGFTPQADGSWFGHGVHEICFTNTAKKPGSMYLSLIGKVDANSNTPMYLYVYYTDGTENAYLALNNNITTFTTLTAQTDPAKTVDYIKWTYGGGGAYYIKDMQISFVDDKYEPHRGDTFNAQDLGQTVYGGSLDWKTGILTVEYGIQDLSELAWFGPSVAYGNTVYLSEEFSAAASMIAGGRKGWCSVFNCLNGITLGTLPNNSLMYSIAEYSGSIRIYIKADGIADVDALMAVLEGQTLVYQLAEPITIQLTPTEILALSGTNCLFSDTGDTTVTGKADINALLEKLNAGVTAEQPV